MFEKDRVAVITGANGGLGTVAAKALAAEGARLVLTGTNAERLDRLAGEVGLPADRLLTGVFDFTRPEAAGQCAERVVEKFGRVDILLHLVGGWTGGKPLAETPADDLSSMLNNHVWTTYYLAQAFVPLLTQNGWGRIVVVSSPHASEPPANMGPYVAAKAAEEALVLTLAKEVGSSGVTANVIQVRTIDAQHERDREPTPKNANWTTPEEITSAILYLCSNDAHVVNGARLPLYGG